MTPHPDTCTLRVATGDLVSRVYGESHSFWGGGLSRLAYESMWRELADLPWARDRFRVLVWTDDGRRVISSVKIYRPAVRIGSLRGDACGIGAVFTPQEHRGHGHARAMLGAVLQRARECGDLIALLFSDIEPTLYETLGFRSLDAREAVGTLRPDPAGRTSGLRLRSLEHSDLPEVKAAHDATSVGRSFAVERDMEHWRFLWTRSEAYFSRLGGWTPGKRFQAAERDGRFVGYLIAMDAEGVWEVREAGARGGDLSMLADIVRAGGAEARQRGLRTVRGWLPREWKELFPEWRLRFQRRHHAIPMVRPVCSNRHVVNLAVPVDSFLPYLDQF